MRTSIKFLGVGGASQHNLGHASIVIHFSPVSSCRSSGENSHLLVDCGPGTVNRFVSHFATLPKAVFITHCHMDHIADLEHLFFRCWFGEPRVQPKLFVPVSLVELLHQRLGEYHGMLAEGGAMFWDAFQLVPITDSFMLNGVQFQVYPARHHGPKSAFSLHLPRVFFYTGDSRPVPEIINHCVNNGELIFHDLCVNGNPSHTGIKDLLQSYSDRQRERMYAYHYASLADIDEFAAHKIKTVRPGDEFIVQQSLDSFSQLVKIDRDATLLQQMNT